MIKNKILMNRIASNIAQETGRDKDTLLFGLQLFLTTFTGYITLIIVGLLLGILKFTIAAAITTSIFRVISGGAHASSQLRCTIFGSVIFTLLGLASSLYPMSNKSMIYLLIIITIFGIYIFYKYSPADTPSKPISSELQRRYLRAISFVILAIWLTLCIWIVINRLMESRIILSSAFGLIWQIVSLTPIGYKIVDRADNALKIITERR